MANETPSRPPPFMANAILNFHFDYVTPSLTKILGCGGESYFCFSLVFCDMENLFFSLEEGPHWGPNMGASLYSSIVSYKVKQILVILT